jgi:hypothetical protein
MSKIVKQWSLWGAHSGGCGVWSRVVLEKSTDIAFYLLHAGFLLGLFFDNEDGGEIFLQNFGWLPAYHMALCSMN